MKKTRRRKSPTPIDRALFTSTAGLWPSVTVRLSIYDSALVMGDMAFEVHAYCSRRPFRLDDHLDRLLHTLSALEIDQAVMRRAVR